MSTLKLKGSTSGYVELTAPATAGDNTITLPTTAGTVAVKDASGNLGIGTDNPGAKLHLYGSGGAATGSEGIRLQTTQATGGNWISFNDDAARKGYFGYKETGDDGIYLVNEENSHIVLGTNGSERLRVLAAGGLTFNGDTAAANALDDYEEGTWTPVVGGTATYGTREGRYTKIGNRVMLTGRINISSIGTGSQNEITGLPFTAASITSNYGGSPAFFTSLAISVVSLTPIVEPGTTSVFFYGLTAGATASSNKINVMQNGTVIDFNITYMTS